MSVRVQTPRSAGLEAWFATHPGQPSAGLTILTSDDITATFSHPTNEDVPGDLSGFYARRTT